MMMLIRALRTTKICCGDPNCLLAFFIYSIIINIKVDTNEQFQWNIEGFGRGSYIQITYTNRVIIDITQYFVWSLVSEMHLHSPISEMEQECYDVEQNKLESGPLEYYYFCLKKVRYFVYQIKSNVRNNCQMVRI